jgi:hypothetical protein
LGLDNLKIECACIGPAPSALSELIKVLGLGTSRASEIQIIKMATSMKIMLRIFDVDGTDTGEKLEIGGY